MQIQIQPNEVTNLTGLLGLPESGAVHIEYYKDGGTTDLVKLALLESEPTINNQEAQSVLVCDRESQSSKKSCFLTGGKSLYAWYKSTDNEPIDLIVTTNQFVDGGAVSSLNNIMTTANDRTSRLPVDQQPTSFEENTQFKIFHRLIDVPSTEQVVFKFDATNPVNIMERKINMWSGGREYLVIPATQALDDKFNLLPSVNVPVTTVNGNLKDSGLPSHPVSGVTITRWKVTGVDQITIGSDDQFPNGDAVNTDGNANRANNSLLSSPNLSGVATNQAFYLVFTNISQSNSATSGHFYLQWEERF